MVVLVTLTLLPQFIEMIRKFVLFHHVILFVLLVICIFQSVMVINDYALLFGKRIWRNRSLDAYERSANFLLGQTGADFMRFIASNTPTDKSVIVVERSANFASQNVLQYFLLPRPIVSCDCDNLGGKCNPCLQSPESYVPATQNFPPPGAVGTEKIFIPFDNPSGKESSYYFGIYVPNEVSHQSLNKEDTWNSLIFIKTLSIDLIVLICLGLLGLLIIHLIIPGIYSIDALSLSIPTGVALLTWFIFLASWAGISITITNILLIYIFIIFSILILSRLFIKNPAFSVEFTIPSDLLDQLRHLDYLSIMSILGIFAMLVFAVFISVGRSYSIYDDIAIWSLKGYGIAYEKTIFAGYLLGGHGLAYPLSLPLSITIFQLASGDMLPGSKFLFPIYTAALLWGSFRFLIRRGVNTRIAYVGMFLMITIPQIFFYTTTGYANMPFTTCLVLGIMWGIDGLMDENKRELLLSSLLIGFAGWIRPEGILFGGILIGILLLWQFLVKEKKVWQNSYWLFPGLIIPGIWLIFAHNYIQGDQAGSALTALVNLIQNGQINFEPFIMTAHYGMVTFLNPKIWGLILPVFLIIFFIALPRMILKPNKAAWLLVTMTLASFIIPGALFFVEAANESNFSTFLAMSFDRAYLPAITLCVVLALTTLFSSPGKDLYNGNKSIDNQGNRVNN